VTRLCDHSALVAELRRRFQTTIEPHMEYAEIHLRLGRAQVIELIESMALDPAAGYSDGELIRLGVK
jgi:hypothetical protein